MWFVWTLIAARTLRTLNTVCFVKGKYVSVWEGKNVEFRRMRLDEMDGTSVGIAEWCARACVAKQ